MRWARLSNAKQTARWWLDRFHEWRVEKRRRENLRHSEPCTLNRCITLTRPRLPSEFEIQATLWQGLKPLGFDVIGQLHMSYSWLSAKLIVDLSIWQGQTLLAFIETKKDRTWLIKFTYSEEDVENQVCKYAMKRPTYLVCSMEEALSFIEVVKKLGHLPSPVELRYYHCEVDHVVVQSDCRFEWNGVEVFPHRPIAQEVSLGGTQ